MLPHPEGRPGHLTRINSIKLVCQTKLESFSSSRVVCTIVGNGMIRHVNAKKNYCTEIIATQSYENVQPLANSWNEMIVTD